MGEEKRRFKRLAIDAFVQMNLIDEKGKERHVDVEVLNMSRTGMGFVSDEDLEIGSYFDVVIQTWNGDVIKTVVEIVRTQVVEDRKWYGASFVGMSDVDQLKIQIYELTSESEG